uniref:Mitochondrial carrier protein n=1 Tax=Parastrongyloides trichosuri TaxID=131310 RepID=A0A0N4ZM63_PARTI
MIQKSICILTFLLSIVYCSLDFGTIKVEGEGRLLCGNGPATDAIVELYDRYSLGVDKLVKKLIVDDEGNIGFSISFPVLNRGNLYVKIFDKCGVSSYECTNERIINLPSEVSPTDLFSPKRRFKMGTIDLYEHDHYLFYHKIHVEERCDLDETYSPISEEEPASCDDDDKMTEFDEATEDLKKKWKRGVRNVKRAIKNVKKFIEKQDDEKEVSIFIRDDETPIDNFIKFQNSFKHRHSDHHTSDRKKKIKHTTTTTLTPRKEISKGNRFWFGGVASGVAGFAAHPIELIKVHLQLQQDEGVSVIGTIVRVYKMDGILGYYSGITGTLFRQLTSSAGRFALYDILKKEFGGENQIPFWKKILFAAISGAIAGFFGAPGDKASIRMMNDVKLPVKEKRNYKHVFDAFYRIIKEEGFLSLFKGWELAVVRVSVLTVGQAASYDHIKILLLETEIFEDNLLTFFTGSFLAAAIATFLTQPIDTIKTRVMNSDAFKGYLDCIVYTLQMGPFAFYKGLIPAFLRIGPYTIILFIVMEYLRIYFGVAVE